MPAKVKKIVKKKIVKKVVAKKRAAEPTEEQPEQASKRPKAVPAAVVAKKEPSFSEPISVAKETFSDSDDSILGKHDAGRKLTPDTDDSDSDSGVDVATLMGGNKNVLNAFIEKRTGNYVEAEVVEGTGKVRDAIVTTLADADRPAQQPSTPFQPENNYLNFAASSGGATTGGGDPAANLDLSTTIPKWLPSTIQDHLGKATVFRNSTTLLHYELTQYLKHTGLSKTERSSRKKIGKSALDVIKSVYPDAVGVLVGSVATRLADRYSSVDVGVWGCGKREDIEAAFDAVEGWKVVKELRGEEGIMNLKRGEVRVTLLLNERGEAAGKAADFLTAAESKFGDKLKCLVVPLKETLRQRKVNGSLTPHILTLLAISYLNARRAARASSDMSSCVDNEGTLLVDFLVFLCFRFNGFLCCLNPSDPTGRVVKKSPTTAPRHHLHVIDPVTKQNCAVPAYNWALTREMLENTLGMLAAPPQCPVPIPGTHHSAHPDITKRPTPLSRLINCEKML